MSVELVMPSNHLIILCHPLLLPASIFPSIRVFSNESALRIRWPKYWSFSFSISSSKDYSGLISFGMDWLDLLTITPSNLINIFWVSASYSFKRGNWTKYYFKTFTALTTYTVQRATQNTLCQGNCNISLKRTLNLTLKKVRSIFQPVNILN